MTLAFLVRQSSSVGTDKNRLMFGLKGRNLQIFRNRNALPSAHSTCFAPLEMVNIQRDEVDPPAVLVNTTQVNDTGGGGGTIVIREEHAPVTFHLILYIHIIHTYILYIYVYTSIYKHI